MQTKQYDAVVVGAGSAGAGAAYQLARRGLRVAVVEQRELAEAGARWINGVAPWMFSRARLALPVAPELRCSDAAFHLFSHDGRHCVRLDRSPVWQVDMRRLVARLQALAADAGVVFFEKYAAREVELDGGRPVALVVHGREGGRLSMRLQARLFVDASGMAGALRRRVALFGSHCEPPAGGDVCSAAQEVRRIRDRSRARRWLENHGAVEGDSVGYVGVDGGFSTVVVQVDFERGEADLLTGSTADGMHRSGPRLLEEFVRSAPWLGRKIFGGAGAIPLRRPYARLVAPGVALAGDSACQVFPAHGSGIGPGLVAGAILGEAVEKGGDPGAFETLWRYQRGCMREIGAVSAAYDAIRQLSQRLTEEESVAMIAAGFTTPGMTAAALAQQMGGFSLWELPQLVRAVRAAPRLAAKMAPHLAKMQAAYRLYANFPEAPGTAWERAWMRVNALLFGDAPKQVESFGDKADERRLAA